MGDVAEGVRAIIGNRDLAMFTGLGAIGAGAVVGSLIASVLVGSRRLAEWFGIGVALWGLPVALIPLFPSEATALTLLACVGIGNALVDVGLFTLMARLAPMMSWPSMMSWLVYLACSRA